MKNGDIYFWSWKELPSKNDYTLSYWCKARKAIVVDGELYDIYWGGRCAGWLDLERVELEFKGNVNDYRVSAYNDHLYYAPEDLINMQHSNDPKGIIYIRKDAKRSKISMMEHAIDKLEDAERQLRYAKQEVERWTNKIKEIDSATDLKDVYL